MARNQIPDRYSVRFPPAFYACGQRVLIDPHGYDGQKKRLKFPQYIDDKLIFDRFVISMDDWELKYLETTRPVVVVGSLADSWLQCRYSWRYRVFDGSMFYWLYEEVTLNAARVDRLDDEIFISTEPRNVYHDSIISAF